MLNGAYNWWAHHDSWDNLFLWECLPHCIIQLMGVSWQLGWILLSWIHSDHRCTNLSSCCIKLSNSQFVGPICTHYLDSRCNWLVFNISELVYISVWYNVDLTRLWLMGTSWQQRWFCCLHTFTVNCPLKQHVHHTRRPRLQQTHSVLTGM